MLMANTCLPASAFFSLSGFLCAFLPYFPTFSYPLRCLFIAYWCFFRGWMSNPPDLLPIKVSNEYDSFSSVHVCFSPSNYQFIWKGQAIEYSLYTLSLSVFSLRQDMKKNHLGFREFQWEHLTQDYYTESVLLESRLTCGLPISTPVSINHHSWHLSHSLDSYLHLLNLCWLNYPFGMSVKFNKYWLKPTMCRHHPKCWEYKDENAVSHSAKVVI